VSFFAKSIISTKTYNTASLFAQLIVQPIFGVRVAAINVSWIHRRVDERSPREDVWNRCILRSPNY